MAYIIDSEPPSDSDMQRRHIDKIIELEGQISKERKRITNLFSFFSFIFVIVIILLIGLSMNIIEARSIIEKQSIVSNKSTGIQPCLSSTPSKEN